MERQRWMAVLARAAISEIEAQMAALPALPDHTRLRGPETGLAMVRARSGGEGAPFNLGEMTVTRCTVRDVGGRIGHAVVAGRNKRQAEWAAALDAALQDPTRRNALLAAVIDPLSEMQRAARAAVAGKAAATRVAFFTMANMRS